MIARRTIAGSLALIASLATVACGRSTDPGQYTELQRVKSGDMDVVLLSTGEAIHHGKDTFTIEFRSPAGALVDVGTLRASATMPMPGMPMFGKLDVRRTDVAGRYAVNAELDMAGTWRMTLEWEGSGGRGSVTFSPRVGRVLPPSLKLRRTAEALAEAGPDPTRDLHRRV